MSKAKPSPRSGDGFAYEIGSEIDGFRLERSEPLPSLRALAREFEHVKSGARFLHLHANDSENCFSLTFPTPPPDDTGLPHILEHCVLAGSRRFPVKEPFFEMVKMSMATFINAMTYPTYTVYPVASNVKKDFFHLVEVYLDAVFHPLISEEIFMREGHHLALENNDDPASPLKISGIVYSEMKGAYSSPEALLQTLVERELYRDTPFGRDSGGDPKVIPSLTFEQFRAFYEERYHPGNARIVSYGDIPTRELLRFLDPVLQEFDRKPAPSPISTRQPRWAEPRRIEDVYPIGSDEDGAGKVFLNLNWIVGNSMDPQETVAWEVIEKLLIGDDAAPLKKALIDSKLGADLDFAYVHSDFETSFHVSLKGSERDRADDFEALVLRTLEQIASGPIASERIEAAFQRLAYQHLEIASLFPLRVALATNATWPYGGDPLTFLRIDRHLEECRTRWQHDSALFNRMIREGLLENPHRLRIVLAPDREIQAKRDAEAAEVLRKRRSELTSDAIAEIARRAAKLEEAQTEPNSPEAIATLPQLRICDLPDKPRPIPTAIDRVGPFTVLRNDVFTNGINYVEISINLAGLPAECYRILPLYADAVRKMGTKADDYVRIAERRSACTGGIWCSIPAFLPVNRGTDPCLRQFGIGLKSLERQTDSAFRLLEDILFELKPRVPERLRDVVTQAKARMRTQLVNEGLSTARTRAARTFGVPAALAHMQFGPDALRELETMEIRYDTLAEELASGLERIRDFLPKSATWTISFTGSDAAFDRLVSMLNEWNSRLNADGNARDALPDFAIRPVPYEGLAAPMNVAYCVKVMRSLPVLHPDYPLFQIGSYLAKFDYLLPEIRLKGNAYGAGAGTDDSSGTFTLHSYRDPSITETLAVFDGIRDFVHQAPWSKTDLERAIIGSVKDAERPIRPGEATKTALARHLRGITDEMRDRLYAETLRATPDRVKSAFLSHLEEAERESVVCVVSSREKLDAANVAPGNRRLTVSDILG